MDPPKFRGSRWTLNILRESKLSKLYWHWHIEPHSAAQTALQPCSPRASSFLLRSEDHVQPRRQRSTSTSCSSKAPKASSLGMIKPRSADRGICLKVLCSVRSTLGAWVEPTSPSSISMMLVASIWATSIERRTCGKSTARSSPISSKTSKTKQDDFCHLRSVSQCSPMFVILLVTSTPNATVSCKPYVSIGVSPLLPSNVSSCARGI